MRKLLHFFFVVNQKIDQLKVLISDDRHNNIHTSSSSNKITITNKNIHTLNKHRTDVNIRWTVYIIKYN